MLVRAQLLRPRASLTVPFPETRSHRIRAGLAAAKARGVKLGGYRGKPPTTVPDGNLGAAALRAQADGAAQQVAPAIEKVRAEAGNAVSLSALARELTARGVATPRGGAWTATAVRRVLSRTAVTD